ncbi:HAD-IA family hydrolase [bacterium]|nr:HAD-IA family hydrolase [bacterium]
MPLFLMFDLDGTLVDSMGDIHIASNLLLAEFGLPEIDLARLRPCIGRGVEYLVHGILLASGWNADIPAGAVPRYRELYAAHALDTTKPYPGVRETLDRLDVNMAVISNKPEQASRAILEALRLDMHFVHIAGGDSYSAMKPSPVPLLSMMELVGAHGEESWMIGDSVYDIEAGKSAGVRTAAVTWGFQPVEKLKALHPERMCSAFEEISDLR